MDMIQVPACSLSIWCPIILSTSDTYDIMAEIRFGVLLKGHKGQIKDGSISQNAFHEVCKLCEYFHAFIKECKILTFFWSTVACIISLI